MPKATLEQVGREALRNRSFFNGLLKSPDKALKKAKLALSPAALRELKTILRKKRVSIDVSITGLFRMVHRLRVDPRIVKGTVWKRPVVSRPRRRPRRHPKR